MGSPGSILSELEHKNVGAKEKIIFPFTDSASDKGFLCLYTHAYVHTHTLICIHTKPHVHIHACVHACIHICAYTYTRHMCTYIHMYIPNTCTEACMHMHTCMHIYTLRHTLGHTHTHTLAHTCTHLHTHTFPFSANILFLYLVHCPTFPPHSYTHSSLLLSFSIALSRQVDLVTDRWNAHTARPDVPVCLEQTSFIPVFGILT